MTLATSADRQKGKADVIGPQGRSIRRRGAGGRLAEAGYEWWEPSQFWLGTALAFLALAVVAGLLVWMEISGATSFRPVHAPTVLYLTGIGSAAIVASIYAATKRQRSLSLIFLKDGMIVTPHGDLYKSQGRRWRFPHGEIRSFESQNEGVFVFLADGDVFMVSKAADIWLRHKIVVQLTNALSDIRGASAASGSVQKGGAARSRTVD